MEVLVGFEELDSYINTYIEYSPVTGKFHWKKYRGPNAMCGRELTHKTSDGYYCVFINGKCFLLSRLAWYITYGVFPSNEIDHINRIKTDNKISNLRDVSRQENALNIRKKANKTGIHNVHWCKREQRYLKYIRENGIRKYIGRAKTLEEAASL
jgi:hypothetical protein